MEKSLIATNVMNFAQCVLELVVNSLNANATSIAIRIDEKKSKIQVVDNGTGIRKNQLKILGEYEAVDLCTSCSPRDLCNARKRTLVNIRRVSDAMILTSRYHESSRTYMKVFRAFCTPNLIKVERRPSCGTTVSIYGFHELMLRGNWNLPMMYFLIANVALVNSRVSFTIRDEHQEKMIMTITKSHNPRQILKPLYGTEVSLHNVWHIRNTKKSDTKFHAYIGLANKRSKASQYIFLNNRPVHCPLILQLVSTTFIDVLYFFAKVRNRQALRREAIFILLFIKCSEFLFDIENGRKTLILPSTQNLLENIRIGILNAFSDNSTSASNIAAISTSVTRDRNLTYSNANNLNIDELLNCMSVHCNIHASQKFSSWRNSIIMKKNSIHTITSRKESIYQNIGVNTFHLLNHKAQINYGVRNLPGKSVIETKKRFGANNLKIKPDSRNKNVNHEKILNELAKHLSDAQIGESFTPTRKNIASIEQKLYLTISQWSNWTYHSEESYNLTKRFEFLPQNLRKLLLPGNGKITRIDCFGGSGASILSAKLKYGLRNNLCHQELQVRPCKSVYKSREFTLRKESIKSVKILGQINNELIAGWIIQNDIKVLLLMDQHAVHERIRYESLLEKYRSQRREQLLSVRLKNPLVLHLPRNIYDLFMTNEAILNKFGLKIGFLSDDRVIVRSVPECLRRNKYCYDEERVKANVESLLSEISNDLVTKTEFRRTNDLPVTIHNAIAMEACHGAIKFGDSLTLEECKKLVNSLKKTKIPTRCAHGRPSVIPLLELPDLKSRNNDTVKKKLNFEALKLFRDRT